MSKNPEKPNDNEKIVYTEYRLKALAEVYAQRKRHNHYKDTSRKGTALLDAADTTLGNTKSFSKTAKPEKVLEQYKELYLLKIALQERIAAIQSRTYDNEENREMACLPFEDKLEKVTTAITDTLTPVAKPKPTWKVKEATVKERGYRRPLLDYLRKAAEAGRPIPSSDEILRAWALERPREIISVTLSKGFDYATSGKRSSVFCSASSLGKTITRNVEKLPE